MRLKELRTAAGLSQRQLAEASGVPYGQVSMIETGRRSPSVASLRKILEGLGVTLSKSFEPDLPQSPQPFFTPAELRDLTSRLYSAARQDQAVPDQQHAALAEGHAVIVLADDTRALRDQEQAAGRTVIDILRHLHGDLAGKIGADAGDKRGRDDGPGL